MECKNCAFALSVDDNFCTNCGAKVIRNRLTIKNLFEHFTEQFLNYDNKFFQTFLNMFRRPEDVIGSYISGTRKKYVNVVSYFAIAITAAGLLLFVLNKYFPEFMNMSSIAQKGTEEFNQKNLEFTQEYQSLLMMLYLPFYALISRLVFLNKKQYNYTEHLVIFMYITAQIALAQFLLIIPLAFIRGIDFGIVSLLLIPLMIVFSAYCLKRLYGLNLGEILLKTMIFLLILFIIAIIAMVVMAFLMFKYEMFPELLPK
jgi:hypothetical protein